MEAPPQSLQALLWRLCWQMPVPPQSLQVLLRRLCGQMLAPPQSLQMLLWRLCGQMLVPPQPFANAAPYTFVLMLDMVRGAWEDQSRHRQGA